MNNDSPASAPDTVVSSEPTINETAAFLFDEPNPVLEPEFAPLEPGTEEPEGNKAPVVTPTEPVAPVVPVVPDMPVSPVAQTPVQQAPPVQEPVVVAPTQTPAQVPATPPSEQEIRQALNIYELSEQDYDAIFDTDDKNQSIKALNDVLQKAVRQAVTMSHALLQSEQQKIIQTVQPYMQFADTQRQVMLESAFYSMHQDLQSAKPVVDAVLKQFQSEGKKFNSEQELFDAVAQNTKAYLSQLAQLGQTVTQAPVRQQQAQAAQKPPMAVLPTGGQGGAGVSGGGSGKVNTAQALFG